MNNAGASQGHIQYSAFGEVISDTTVVDHLFGYTGREFDEETGLQYNRARYYDPSIGRFLSTDPSGFSAGDANLYRYVGNSPTIFVDPTGLRVASPVSNVLGQSSGGRQEAFDFGINKHSPGFEFADPYYVPTSNPTIENYLQNYVEKETPRDIYNRLTANYQLQEFMKVQGGARQQRGSATVEQVVLGLNQAFPDR